jgi:hypothetical protein
VAAARRHAPPPPGARLAPGARSYGACWPPEGFRRCRRAATPRRGAARPELGGRPRHRALELRPRPRLTRTARAGPRAVGPLPAPRHCRTRPCAPWLRPPAPLRRAGGERGAELLGRRCTGAPPARAAASARFSPGARHHGAASSDPSPPPAPVPPPAPGAARPELGGYRARAPSVPPSRARHRARPSSASATRLCSVRLRATCLPPPPPSRASAWASAADAPPRLPARSPHAWAPERVAQLCCSASQCLVAARSDLSLRRARSAPARRCASWVGRSAPSRPGPSVPRSRAHGTRSAAVPPRSHKSTTAPGSAVRLRPTSSCAAVATSSAPGRGGVFPLLAAAPSAHPRHTCRFERAAQLPR